MWSLWMAAMAAETFFASSFEPKTALLFESARAPGKLQLLLVEDVTTCAQAQDVRQRSAWLTNRVKMVASTFPSMSIGTVAREVSASQGLDQLSMGGSATLLALPKAPGPGGKVRLDLTGRLPSMEVAVILDREVEAVWCGPLTSGKRAADPGP